MVREYRPSDYGQIVTWCNKRDASAPPPNELPRVGFIVDGIAAGFLCQTDTSIAFLSCYIADSDSLYEERDVALDVITQELLNKAKELGFTGVRCDSKSASVKARAMKFGFCDLGVSTCLFRKIQ